MGKGNKPAPNILFIISDEHRKDAMGCAGHPIVKTPHLDGLAAHGTLFENAYTPSPMCVPTRAALATARYVHQTGNWESATPYDGRPESWMHVMREAGRPVTSIGKLHFRSTEDDNGFAEEILPMHVVGGIGWTIGLLRENPPEFDGAAELARDAGKGDSSYTGYDKAITEAAVEWIENQAEEGEPWVLSASFVSPHYPLTAPEEFFDLYDPNDMDWPVGYDSDSRPTHQELANITRFFDYDRHFDPEKIRTAKAAYYGLISYLDVCVGQLLAALKKSGQAENTIVIYVSDHGDMMGDHGIWTKQVMYEASAGVPMIISGPSFPQGQRVKTPCSLVDVGPTICDLAGIDPGETGANWPGTSLRHIANRPDDPERTAFSEYHDGGSTTASFMVRWSSWKYVHYVGLPPQLFDLANDPLELIDLVAQKANSPAVAAALAEGERRLRDICDPGAVNARCFANQAQRIDELGGKDACANNYAFNHTPTPDEQDGKENA